MNAHAVIFNRGSGCDTCHESEEVVHFSIFMNMQNALSTDPINSRSFLILMIGRRSKQLSQS